MTCALLLPLPCDVISIHMPHTWHDMQNVTFVQFGGISIHMPHTWHDRRTGGGGTRIGYFNPHATYVA